MNADALKTLGQLPASVPAEVDDQIRFDTIRDAVHRILSVIDNPTRPDLVKTPDRVAEMYLELTHTDPLDLSLFDNTDGYDEMVIEDDIPFYSLCEHHIVPFFGFAKVAYIPKSKIVGLSKLARAVDHFAAGLQTQERITNTVADYLWERLDSQGVGVRLSAEHLAFPCEE